MSSTIDPSIAEIVNIDSVALKETLPVTFHDPEGWKDNYELTVWNSEAKNTEYKMSGALVIDDKDITFNISPFEYDLKASKYYYEIWNVTTDQIEFKGDLIIRK